MLFSTDKEKEAVRRALKVFLAQQETTLYKVFKSDVKKYHRIHQQITKGKIDEAVIKEVIETVDPRYNLKKIADTWIISKSL